MKKTTYFVLILFVIVTLTGCVKTIEITRREEEPNRIGECMIATDITLGEALAFHIEFCRSIEPVNLYFPQEGRFATEDGEEFEAKVLKCDYRLDGSAIKTAWLSCHIQIWSLGGELITEQTVICSNDYYDNANDDMKPYWDVIKISVDDLTESETEEK